MAIILAVNKQQQGEKKGPTVFCFGEKREKGEKEKKLVIPTFSETSK